jgi:hypothetical protein
MATKKLFFAVEGEWACGEIWLGNAHYEYERTDDGEVVLYNVGTLTVVGKFDDTDEGWRDLKRGLVNA